MIGYVLSQPALAAVMPGPLSHHMLRHIIIMDVMAPCFAAMLIAAGPRFARTGVVSASVAPATAAQIAALWIWHSPSALDFAMNRPVGQAAMQASLFGVGLWFWLTVFGQRQAARWRAIVALLMTAKLFCLLGVVLAFSPRPLYAPPAGHGFAPVAPAELLYDQQLAGIVMLAACPLIYVLGGLMISAAWLRDLRARRPCPDSRLPESGVAA